MSDEKKNAMLAAGEVLEHRREKKMARVFNAHTAMVAGIPHKGFGEVDTNNPAVKLYLDSKHLVPVGEMAPAEEAPKHSHPKK